MPIWQDEYFGTWRGGRPDVDGPVTIGISYQNVADAVKLVRPTGARPLSPFGTHALALLEKGIVRHLHGIPGHSLPSLGCIVQVRVH